MNLVKTTAVVLVILAGIIGSYFILKNPNIAMTSGENDKISDLSRQILDKNPIQWIEKAKEQISAAANSGSESPDVSNSSQINLTDLAAKSMFSGMQQMLQNGNASTTFDPNDQKNQEKIQSAISGIQDPLSYYDLSIDEKAVKISQDNSMQNKGNYLSGVVNIIAKNQTDAYKNPIDAVNKAVLSGDPSGLKQLTETYQNLFKGLINIPVPSNWLELHKKYLRFMKKAEIVYSGISDIQSDPIKASLFVQKVSDLIKEEIGIRKEYYKLATGIDL